MKKRITAALLIVSLGAAAIPVYAAGETQSKVTILNAKVDSAYTLTIPLNTDITFNQISTELNGVLTVSGNVDVGETVTVEAKTNSLHNASQKTDLPYTLNNEQKIFKTAQWSEEELRAGLLGEGKGKEIQLSIEITEADWKAAKAGSYIGSITFEAKLE